MRMRKCKLLAVKFHCSSRARQMRTLQGMRTEMCEDLTVKFDAVPLQEVQSGSGVRRVLHSAICIFHMKYYNSSLPLLILQM
jgi:hypothetical protein